MAITLQDVSMLTGLPLAGQAIVLPDPPVDWRDDIIGRYACIVPEDDSDIKGFFSEDEARGPTLHWLSQFEVGYMRDHTENYHVELHLEAYLLWFFGWVMFTSGHGNTVDARMINLASHSGRTFRFEVRTSTSLKRLIYLRRIMFSGVRTPTRRHNVVPLMASVHSACVTRLTG
uniref:Aminotransferase-like plant mobile domain-containing protein n=1 Tax=Oryza glaberrima TaxID=4538 RepID=I1QL79_ORYGL